MMQGNSFAPHQAHGEHLIHISYYFYFSLFSVLFNPHSTIEG